MNRMFALTCAAGRIKIVPNEFSLFGTNCTKQAKLVRDKKEDFHIHLRKPSQASWASRIRTYEMTESESVALPLGYSPMYS